MARVALAVGDAVGSDEDINAALGRFGYDKLERVSDVAVALERLGAQHVELVFVALDVLDESTMARLDRATRLERHTSIIGTATTPDPDLMLRAMRSGIQEFLVRPLANADLSASLERLSRRTTAATVSGQVIATFSAKGGVGNSTVAVNLADALARLHPQGRVALVDLVVTGGEARLLLNVNPDYDLSYVAERPEQIDRELLNSVLVPAVDGVWLLAAPDRPDAEDIVDATVINAVLQQLRQTYNYTVLDCERVMNDRTLAALDAADRIVLTTQLNVSSMRSTQRSLAIFRRLGYPNEKLCVVVNRFQSGEVITPADASEVLKSEIFFKLPNDYKVASDAVTRGVPVSTADPSSKLTWGFNQLAQKLTGTAGHEGNGAKSNGQTSRLRSLFNRKKG
ncbi:MAG: AAA family ATPase [Gemmatimonadaceae bacterium]